MEERRTDRKIDVMPVMIGKDSEGCYARWGKEGKKYYYECGNTQAREKASNKAKEQGKAIKVNKLKD